MAGNIKARTTLEGYFAAGEIPREGHFYDFIATGFNQNDDGMKKTVADPLKIQAGTPGEAEELIRFYSDINGDANWVFSQNPIKTELSGNDTANTRVRGLDIGSGDGTSRFFISEGGQIGIGTTVPTAKLDIMGGHIKISGGLTLTGNPTDTFVYDRKRMTHYGLGWFGDGWTNHGPTAWLSGYGGIKLFTTGAPRLVVNTEGKVGIGTNTPNSNLSIREDSKALTTLEIKNRYGGENIDPENSGSQILFIGYRDVSPNWPIAGIRAMKVNGNRTDKLVNAGELQFFTHSGNGPYEDPAQFKKRMTIDKWGKVWMGGELEVNGKVNLQGNLGIGTSNPASRLHITVPANERGLEINSPSAGNTHLPWTDNWHYISGHGVIFRDSSHSEKLLIDLNTGNVGIGAGLPSSNLHVSSGETGDCKLILESDTNNSNENANPYLIFRQDGGYDESAIYMEDNRLVLANAVSVNSGIVFKTAQSSSSVFSEAIERMRITPDGNIGIGNTNPAGKLTINISNNEDGLVVSSQTTGNTHFPHQDNWNYISGNGAIFRNGANQEKFRLDTSSNRMGIGTSQPRANLDIQSGPRSHLQNHPTEVPGLYVTGGLGPHSNGVEFRHSNGTQGIGIAYTSIYAAGSNPNQNLNLLPRGTGKVGIGKTSPGTMLDVNGNASFSGCIIPSVGNNEGSGIRFPNDAFGGSGDRAYIRYYARSGEQTTLEIGNKNDNNDHIALMPGGNVGIGTTNPQAKLEVNGDIKVNGKIFARINNSMRQLAERVVAVGFPPQNTSLAYWHSDIRLKEKIKNIPQAVAKVSQLNGVQFEWNQNGLQQFSAGIEDQILAGMNATAEENQALWDSERSRIHKAHSGTQLGLLAQDVEGVLPELVKTDDQGFKQVRYDLLAGLFVEAIKEQQIEIDACKQQVDQQKLITELIARIEALENNK